MTRYNLYDDGQYHGGVKLIAIEAGSELDQAQAAESHVKFVATIETESSTEFSPTSSSFQSNQTNDYIQTGLTWPCDQAVVVR